MSSTDIEKESLEAHVELCAERYKNLDGKLNHLEGRMTRLEEYLVEIKDTLTNTERSQYKTIVGIGAALVGALVAAAASMVLHIITNS